MTDYLNRLAERRTASSIERQAVFGLAIGILLMALSAWNILFVVGSSPTAWRILLGVGAILFSLAIIIPQGLAPIEKLWSIIFRKAGRVLFSSFLVILYGAVIIPTGLLYRKTRGANPYYRWHDSGAGIQPHWQEKHILLRIDPTKGKNRNVFVQLFHILLFFVRQRNWLIIPVIILFLALGMVFFFVETSTLAPFIYTLF